MTIKTEKAGRVYRFRDCVAFDTDSMPDSVYMTPETALKMAAAFKLFARDCMARKMCESTLHVHNITEG
jgi:hypothetical protein